MCWFNDVKPLKLATENDFNKYETNFLAVDLIKDTKII